jgi:hypothetical protein
MILKKKKKLTGGYFGGRNPVVKSTGRWVGAVLYEWTPSIVYRYRIERWQKVREKFAGMTSGRPWPKNGPNRH